MRTLVVDDNEGNRKLLSWVLEDEGHEVVEAADGQEAVDCFAKEPFDLIMMDVMMPVMDGYDAAKTIKGMTGASHVPIIFLTALEDEESLSRCLEVGGDDFLSKPFNSQILHAKVNAHTRIKDLTDQINDQNQVLHEQRQAIEHEHNVACDVFNKVFAASQLDVPGINYHIAPAELFNGDLLIGTPSPSGGIYIVLADFTGHGLPAAAGALPVSQVFFDITKSGSSVGVIAREINKSLSRFLPDNMFAAASIFEINSEGDRISMWNGGLPDLFLIKDGKLIRRIESAHMPLGILEDYEFEDDVEILQIERGTKLLAYTDGIIEATDAQDKMYGYEGLEALIDGQDKDYVNTIVEDVDEFLGHVVNQDDVTMLEITSTPLQLDATSSQTIRHEMPWSFEVILEAEQLKHDQPLRDAINLVCSYKSLSNCKDELQCVITELYTNALEHGILSLSSQLKLTEEGYLEYYELRSERQSQLTDAFVKLNFEYFVDGDDTGKLQLTMKDSGSGFDYSAYEKSCEEIDGDNAFGRGVALLKAICETVEYSENGTCVRLIYDPHKEV